MATANLLDEVASSAKVALALVECNKKLRPGAIRLLKQLASGQLDDYERFATVALLTDILFPHGDVHGRPGVDLVEEQDRDRASDPNAAAALELMEREQTAFGQRVRIALTSKSMTAGELAGAAGLAPSAVELILAGEFRPQTSTVHCLAAILEVPADELWTELAE